MQASATVAASELRMVVREVRLFEAALDEQFFAGQRDEHGRQIAHGRAVAAVFLGERRAQAADGKYNWLMPRRQALPMSTGLPRIHATNASAMARRFQPPLAIKAEPSASAISVSSVTRPGFKCSQPPPMISLWTLYCAAISRAVMNSTVAPSASPMARPRKAPRARFNSGFFITSSVRFLVPYRNHSRARTIDQDEEDFTASGGDSFAAPEAFEIYAELFHAQSHLPFGESEFARSGGHVAVATF